MSLSDKDIFMAICEKCKDQPIEIVMMEYEKAVNLNAEIEKRRLADIQKTASVSEPVCKKSDVEVVPEKKTQEVEIQAIAKKKYDKRSFKVKPNEAITDDLIYCCICGEGKKLLSSTHIQKHDITVEEYKKLCGYPANLSLMSKNQLAKSHSSISLAHDERMRKIAENKHL